MSDNNPTKTKLTPQELEEMLDGPGMDKWRQQQEESREKHEQGVYVEITNAKQFRGMHPNKIIATLGKKRRSSLTPEEKEKLEARIKREHEWAEERGTAIIDNKGEKDE